MDFKEMGCDAGDWIDLAQDKVHWLAYVSGSNEPLGSLKAN